ncbi:MAG TPA: helix-turn-helix domain-containing protein [Acidimicrobiales bacterium]|jgi:AcrR family transcriptional regulator|nr:helix-turn-helix domain-containing protein [Acidimicrobiales bacterium]
MVPAAASPVAERPLRRDAELNLERILTAAQDVFARLGYEASMEQIASAAGVGVGTLYRRFPNKESLVVAVVEMAGQRSRLQAQAVLAECSEADGIFEFMRRCLQTPSNLRALVSRSPKLEETHRTMIATVAPAIERLIANAKAAGSLRHDVTFSDIAVVLMSVRSVGDRCGDIGAQQAERHLQLLMDGLRVTDGTAVLPHRPLTRAQLDVLLVRE